MNPQQNEVRRLLEKEGASLVLQKEGKPPRIDYQSGLLPLWQAYQEEDWAGGALADRVIGRGAAFLVVAMELNSVYSLLMSSGAREVLVKANIDHGWGRMVNRIKDRSGKGICPMEALLEGIEDPEKAVEKLQEFFAGKISG